MVTYRPGRLPRSGVARFEAGPFHGETMAIPWPPSEFYAGPAAGRGAYRRTSYTDEPPLEAVYEWESGP